MRNGVVVLLGLLAIDLPVSAENGVFKCTGSDGMIVYQGAPCQARQQQVTMVEPRKQDPEPIITDTPAAKSGTETGGQRSVLVGEDLVPGMSDTKVLNMRGWGRPQNIARSRAEDGWREEWTYVSRNDGPTRLVQFVNGKVAGVRSQDALHVGRATARHETQQLADQARRAAESLQVGQAPARDDAQRTGRVGTRSESAAIATSDAPLRATIVSAEPSLNGPQREDPHTDHAARAAAALARIEESRREPLPIARSEPTKTSEPVKLPLETILHTSAERQFAQGENTIVQ